MVVKVIDDNLTEKLRNHFSGGLKTIGTLYCREEVKETRDSVLRADPSAKHFRRRELARICKVCGMDTDALLANEKLLMEFPTRDELGGKIDELIFSMYELVPSPADSMERIVRRLAPEYKKDSVRMAILKKFVSSVGYDCKTINIRPVEDWAMDHMNMADKTKYALEPNNKEKMKKLLGALNETIFDSCRDTVELLPRETLELMISKAQTIKEKYHTFDKDSKPYEFDDIVISEKTKEMLDYYCAEKGYGDFRNKSSLEAMNAIIDNDLSSLAEAAPLINQLEKEYKTWLNTVYYTDRKGNPKKAFQIYKEARKDVKEKIRKLTSIELVKMANDLAAGVFKTDNGMIRERLYLFAIVLNMTARVRENDIADPQSDIEKNLFEDYYCDNLIRFLSDRYKSPVNASIFEDEPTGESINFKNYVEAIYLYYLVNNRLKLTPGQKIDRARAMIAACEEYVGMSMIYFNAKKGLNNKSEEEERIRLKAVVDIYSQKQYREYKEIVDRQQLYTEDFPVFTYIYREDYLPELIELSEKEVPGYMAAHYLIRQNDTSVPKLMVAASENTAYSTLSTTLKKYSDLLDPRNEKNDPEEKKKTDRNEELFRNEENDSSGGENILLIENMLKLADRLITNHQDDHDFVRLMKRLKNRISFDFRMTGRFQASFTAAVLRTLYLADDYLNADQIRKAMNYRWAKYTYQINRISAVEIKKAITSLQKIGYEIDQVTTDAKIFAEVYRLIRKEEYRDDRLNELLAMFADPDDFDSITYNEAVDLLSDLLLLYTDSGRLTRNMMVISGAIDYAQSDDVLDEVSLPSIYEGFAAHINEKLEESRYQKISEKNILDIFVVCGIYANIIEENA